MIIPVVGGDSTSFEEKLGGSYIREGKHTLHRSGFYRQVRQYHINHVGQSDRITVLEILTVSFFGYTGTDTFWKLCLMRVDLPKKVMISVRGTYKDGVVEVDKPLKLSRTDGEVKVIVTFLEEDQVEPRRLTKEDFSFARSRESSKRYQGNLSDAVIEERTSER